MKHKNLIELKNVCLFRYNDAIIFLNSKGRVVLNLSKSDSYPKCQIDSNFLKIDKSLLFRK